jgi:nitrate reductase delta subunit
MRTFKVFSILLSYPQAEWVAALPELEAALVAEAAVNGRAADRLFPLFSVFKRLPQIELEEIYVATFDRNPSHSLHLFEHVHGESRDRGAAMIDLLKEYWKYDFDASAAELPDYVPLFLEFLSLIPDDAARVLLGDAIHVLAAIGRKLERNGSPYATVFRALEALSPVAAQDLVEPPVRDMDEALAQFGPTVDGVEPLLKPASHIAFVPVPSPRARTTDHSL